MIWRLACQALCWVVVFGFCMLVMGCEGEIESRVVQDKYIEAEKRFWEARSECVSRDWDTLACLQTKAWEQERIDTLDHVLHVFYTYVDGDRKMKRVFLDPGLWDRVQVGDQFDLNEYEGLASYDDPVRDGEVRNLTMTSNTGAVLLGIGAALLRGSKRR